ncbi:hypothetical protein ZTR_02981 [Talaromyces verruculosus]|nr:hypothetical protein ZTR_02981 [Talaromyces verruculosus]
MCIYVILRVLEKDEDVTDFDMPLIQTTLKVGRSVGEPEVRHCKPCSAENPIPRWESWILDESIRRTLFIIIIVLSLFDTSAGVDYKACGCAEYVSGLALPSTKSMWNSRTGSEWEQEYVGSPVQSDFGGKSNQVLTFGDLLLQQNSDIEYDSDINGNLAGGGLMLDQWLARVDEVGTLVMSAAKFSEETFYR